MATVLLVASGAAWGEEALTVIKLRTEKVALYDCKDATKKMDYAGKDFKGPWKASPGTPGTPAAGFLQVEVNGQRYCVKPYAVETNKRVSVTADCGAVVAATQPKSAATRGVGEECKR